MASAELGTTQTQLVTLKIQIYLLIPYLNDNILGHTQPHYLSSLELNSKNLRWILTLKGVKKIVLCHNSEYCHLYKGPVDTLSWGDQGSHGVVPLFVIFFCINPIQVGPPEMTIQGMGGGSSCATN